MTSSLFSPAHTDKLRPSFTLLIFALIVFLTSGFSDCGGNTPPVQDSFDPRYYDLGEAQMPLQPEIVASARDPRTGFLYVGGNLSSRGHYFLRNIAGFDPDRNEWFPLSDSGLVPDRDVLTVAPVVQALAISGKYLYVGGTFNRIADTGLSVRNIARYDLDTKTWESLSAGGLSSGPFTGAVRALAISGDYLYAAGEFNQTADGTTGDLGNIARYDTNSGNGQWEPLGAGGLNGTVYALAFMGVDLYAGGQFSDTLSNDGLNLRNIARYRVSSNTWNELANGGLNGRVSALAVTASFVYAGGSFQRTGDEAVANLRNIARYNPALNSWQPLASNGLSQVVLALGVSGDHLFAGGNFSQTSDGVTTGLRYVAHYDTALGVWSALPDQGLNSPVRTFCFSGSASVYIGGNFSGGFAPNSPSYSGILRYQFAPEGRKLSAPEGAVGNLSKLGPHRSSALNGKVRGLAADANGYVYAGGEFTAAADGTQLRYLARFDPATSTWAPLAANGVNGAVNALAISGDDLFVAGNFFATGNGATQMRYIGRYNLTTQTWFPLSHQGVNAFPRALAVAGGNLFVGGQFTSTFDEAVPNLNYLAKYEIATGTWSPVTGNGTNSYVLCLAASGDQVFAGGYFDQTFDGATTNLRYVARYNATTNTWSGLVHNGLNSFVYGLTVSDNYLIARGEFTATANNAVAMNLVGTYNFGSGTWAPVTSGLEVETTGYKVLASVRLGNELYLGGEFLGLGSRTAMYFTRVYLQQWKTPAPNSDWFDGANWTTGTVPAPNSNAVIPAGAGTINITATEVTMKDLMLNGGVLNVGAGRTLTINGILSLAGGVITGEGTVVMTNCQSAAIVGGDDSSFLQTALVRCVDNNGTFNFPVGTANGFSPVTVKETAGSGTISIKAQHGVYPGPATGLPVNRLARWWQIENPGGGVTGSRLVFGYRPGDITGAEGMYQAFRIANGTATPIAGSINTFTDRVLTGPVTGFSDWTLAGQSPTAATVSIGGRVVSSSGNGIGKVAITLTDLAGGTRTVVTGPFGYYRFDEVPSGENYVVSVRHKSYGFTPEALMIDASSDLVNVDFVQTGGAKKPPR